MPEWLLLPPYLWLQRLLPLPHFIFIEVERQLQLVGIKTYSLITVEPLLDTFYLLHLLLSILRVFPKVRSLGAELLLFKFYFLLVYIEIVMQSDTSQRGPREEHLPRRDL